MADLPLFQQIKLPAPPSNSFDLSYSNHLTTDFGRITPILVKETLPADKINELGSELFIRSLPLVAPVMGRVKAYVHGFFVPNRIMWTHWERFISGWDGITIADQTDPVAPYIQYLSQAYLSSGMLSDYLGVPSYLSSGLYFPKVLAFRHNAYLRIYDEWYRDQNLESSVYSELSDGDNNTTAALHVLRYRAYKKDYFTSALPWPQRGNQMTFPLGTSAPVKATSDDVDVDNSIFLRFSQNVVGGNNHVLTVQRPTGASTSTGLEIGVDADGSPDTQVGRFNFSNSHNGQVSNLYADLQAANVLTVNEFRRTMALQRWLETNARGGSRYNETLYAHFGVKIPDYRINRSQYLGGSSIQFNVDSIAQTSGSDDVSAQGNLAGKATAYGYCGILDQPFYPMEHGILMLLLTIMPEPFYWQGIDRHLSKFDKFDYAWPEFANLGEQEIPEKELFYDFSGTNSNEVTFGYQSRFAEDKFSNNEIHGMLRDSAMNFWMVKRKGFTTAPTLSNTFLKVNPDNYEHIFAYSELYENVTDHFIVEVYNHYKVERALPIFGIPE